jgi:hypothetical protein
VYNNLRNEQMKNVVWYDCFLEALFERFPKKTLLVEALMDLLYIEREAVYRRLRNRVPFSIHEIVKISSTWNISLDAITGKSTGKISFLMQPIDYVDPSKQAMRFLHDIVQSINNLNNYHDTEFMDICNKLPRQLLAGYGFINQFHLFKSMYNYGNEKNPVPFGQVIISEEMRKLTADYYRAIKSIHNTNYIFDRMIFDHLVNDIRYFHSIKMITGEEKDLVKRDLIALLDYLLDVATHGCFPETNNKVNLFISDLNVDTNYRYIFTNQLSIFFVHVFDKFEIYTLNTEMVENFKVWLRLKKRSSIQISEVDNRSRIEYFAKQRQIVDML